MEFSEEVIKKIFPQFWKKNQKELKYYKNGKEVIIDSIEKCVVLSIDKGEFYGDCNFAIILDLGNVFIENYGEPLKGKTTIKVGLEFNPDSKVHYEVIENIKDKRIDLL